MFNYHRHIPILFLRTVKIIFDVKFTVTAGGFAEQECQTSFKPYILYMTAQYVVAEQIEALICEIGIKKVFFGRIYHVDRIKMYAEAAAVYVI